MIEYHLVWYNILGKRQHSELFCHCIHRMEASPTPEEELANKYHWDTDYEA